MLNPSRNVCLVACTIVGAVCAYVFGVNQVRTQLEGELMAPSSQVAIEQIHSDPWVTDASRSHQPPTLNQPSFEPPAWVNEDEETPHLASESNPDLSQFSAGTANQASYEQPVYSQPGTYSLPDEYVPDVPAELPAGVQHAANQQLNPGLQQTDDVFLLEVPRQDAYVPVTTAEYVVPAEGESFSAGPIGVEGSDAVSSAAAQHTENAAVQPTQSQVHASPTGSSDEPLRWNYGSFQSAEQTKADSEDQPYVVYNSSGSRPLLTLKIGRTESRRLSSSEMNRAEPIRPALPALRGTRPQASLFVEVNENDRTCAIRAQHVRLRDLLTTLGERAGIWISATQHVGGLVSADIADVRIEEAIEEIAGPLGYSVGVRDDAILVGLHDEVSGYERRLRDFSDFDKARIAARSAEFQQHQTQIQATRNREFQMQQARMEQARIEQAHIEQAHIEQTRMEQAHIEQARIAQAREQQARFDRQQRQQLATALPQRQQPTNRHQPARHSHSEIALVSHTEIYRSPSKATLRVLESTETAAGSMVTRDGRAGTHPRGAAKSAEEALPMHAGPTRPPSTEAILEARRAKIASEEDNVVSVIAERALNQIKAGEYRRVINMLSQLVTEHQRSAQLFQLLGEAYYHCEQYDAAQYSLEHSLKLYKNDARSNYFLGCVLSKQGNRQRSLHYLLQAHDIDPMYPPVVSETAVAPR